MNPKIKNTIIVLSVIFFAQLVYIDFAANDHFGLGDTTQAYIAKLP